MKESNIIDRLKESNIPWNTMYCLVFKLTQNILLVPEIINTILFLMLQYESNDKVINFLPCQVSKEFCMFCCKKPVSYLWQKVMCHLYHIESWKIYQYELLLQWDNYKYLDP